MTVNAFGSFSWHVFILFVIVFRESREEETFCTKQHLLSVVVERGRSADSPDAGPGPHPPTPTVLSVALAPPSPVLTCLVTFFLWL